MIYSPTSIDLSRVPAPDAIEPLNFETLFSDFMTRFLSVWNDARAVDPTLPEYSADALESEPVVIVGQAFSYIRLLDRARVNDAIKAVLAPFATGADLDNVVARQGIARLVVVPATGDAPAILETDLALLRRYLLSFDRAAAGSRDGYLFQAWTAWPGMLDARVNGFAVHGRRGDTDVVIIGPDGAAATLAQFSAVSNAVRSESVKPEAVSVTVLDAVRVEYAVDLVIEIPAGPDAELVRSEAEARVTKAAAMRTVVGGEIPRDYLSGAAYGANIIKVRDLAPVTIAPDPYSVPVLSGLSIAVEVRS